MHRIDQTVPIEVSMEAMNGLKRECKIKYVGLSECSSQTIRMAHAVCPLTCIQMEIFDNNITMEEYGKIDR